VPKPEVPLSTTKEQSRPKAPPNSNLMIANQVTANGGFDF
jgi:hypothetical protein